jgi:hypothetical protein
VLNTPAPIGGGSYGQTLIESGGSNYIALGPYSSGSASAIYFMGETGANFGFLGNTVFTILNSPSGGDLYLQNAGNTLMHLTPSLVEIAPQTTHLISGGANTFGTTTAAASLQFLGDAAANIFKITTAYEHQTYVDIDAVSAPAVPSATQIRVYVDTLDNKLKAKDNAGNVTVLAP